MDFDDTPEEAAFRAEARAWLEANTSPLNPGEINPGLGESDDPDTIRAAQEWQAKKADAGWACITWPKAYGGRGGTPIQSVIWGQEEGRVRVPPNVFGIGPWKREIYELSADPREAAPVSAPSAEAVAAEGRLRQWLGEIDSRPVRRGPLDPETERRLRALGYIE